MPRFERSEVPSFRAQLLFVRIAIDSIIGGLAKQSAPDKVQERLQLDVGEYNGNESVLERFLVSVKGDDLAATVARTALGRA